MRVAYNRSRGKFPRFDPNGLADPELFYSAVESQGTTGSVSREYVPGAWVYPIYNGRTEVGHIAVSARPESPRVIRSSTAKAPQNRLSEDNVGGKRPQSSGGEVRFLYNNPMSFGVTTDSSTFVDLRSGQDASIDAVTTRDDSAERDSGGIEVTAQELDTRDLSFEPLGSDQVSGVPNYDANRCDRSGNWVGCVPAASSMCIGYHESVPDACDLMWELHDLMGTDSQGDTWPYEGPGNDDFLSGIEAYDSSYSSGYELWGRRDEIKNEIDAGRPTIVGYFGDKSPSSVSTSSDVQPTGLRDKMVGHAETVYGYEEGDNAWYNPTDPTLYVSTYDTYGNENELSFGTWDQSFVVLEIET